MKKVNIAVVIIFGLLSLIGIYHHEIWLDEAHHFVFARDSNTIAELFYNMRYDGHPILWNLILFGITRFSQDVVLMQVANVVISLVAVYVFLFYSPFALGEKILFVCGYFVLYEYTVISRNYSLFMLFLFMAVVLYQKKNFGWLGLILALFANTHLFGLLAGACFAGAIVVTTIVDDRRKITRQLIVGLVIFLIGAVASVWQVIPPSDSSYFSTVEHVPATVRLARTSAVFLKGFIPFPDFTDYYFWNTNILMTVSKPFCVILSMLLFVIPVFLFRGKLLVTLFFYGTSILLLIFFFLTDRNAVRYYGVIYLVFVSCIWINGSLPELKSGKNYSRIFFIAGLIIHAVAGIGAYTLDIIRPFSGSKAAAEAMLKDREVTEYVSSGCVAPISAYVGKKVYDLSSKQYESFCWFFGPGQTSFLGEEGFLKNESINFVRQSHRPAFLIARIPLSLSPHELRNITYIGSFDKCVLRGENYYVYKVFE